MGSSDNKAFKVIIAGGGIDYILLESHGEFAPQVGASIGLFPNGLRILDQIGVYKRITDLPLSRLSHLTIRGPKGELLLEVHDYDNHYKARYGYPLLFFDRQWLLEALYAHVQHKERLLPNQKVTHVELIKGEGGRGGGVSVTTDKGDVFTGDMLIGADGVHSAVRGEMFRIGNQLSPGLFPAEESERVPCYYKCSYGIAQHVPNWVVGDDNFTTGDGISQILLTGPENRVYWFLFVRLPEVKYGKDIPKYTKEDEVRFMEKYKNLPGTDKVKLGDMFERRLSSALTPLHEVVFKKWFFNRILILGDASHKPNPIGGQGGNGALETAAELVNALLSTKESRGYSSLSQLNEGDVEQLFARVQAARRQRAQDMVDLAHRTQALYAFEQPLKSSLALKYLAMVPTPERFFGQLDVVCTSGSKLDKSLMPAKAYTIPYKDKLQHKPITGTLPKVVSRAHAASMLALAVAAWRSGCENTLSLTAQAATTGQAGQGIGPKLALLSAASQLVAPLVTYMVEGSRASNAWTPLALSPLATIGMSAKGAAFVGALHGLLTNLRGITWTPAGRRTPLHVAGSILPGVAVGYLLPLAGLVVLSNKAAGGDSQRSRALLSKLFLYTPPLVSAVSYLSSRLLRWWSGKQHEDLQADKAGGVRYQLKDAPILQLTYLVAGALQASAYVAASVYSGRRNTSSSSGGVGGIPDVLGFAGPLRNGGNIVSSMSGLLKSDVALAALSWVATNLYAIWDLRRLGYISSEEASRVALLTIAGQTTVGPGATWMAVSYWRGKTVAGLSRH